MTDTTSEKTSIEYRQLRAEVRSLARLVKDLIRQVETLDEDRNILEEMQHSIISFQDASRLHRDHVVNLIGELKREVQVRGQRTEDTVQEHVGELVENISAKKTVVMVNKSIIDKFRDLSKIIKPKGGGK